MTAKYILIFSFIFCSLFSAAQEEYTTTNRKAIKYFEAAYKFYNERSDSLAVKNLKESLKNDERFVEAWMLLSAIYEENTRYEEAITCKKKAVEIMPTFSYKVWYELGTLQLILGKYQDSKVSFEKCYAFPKVSENFKKTLDYFVARCDFAINAIEHPVPFAPVKLGPEINTEYDEYWPSLTADESEMIYTVLLPIKPEYPIDPPKNCQEDFFISTKNADGTWSKGKNAGPPLNTPGNEGAQCISPDGQWLFYTVCNRPEDYGSCDIYFARKNGNKWSKPANLGPVVNGGSWDVHPSFSSDGRTLYYISSRKGGLGKSDIWSTQLNDDGSWSEPENLGDSVNTPGEEVSPFIHPDNQTLYFSSDGLMGMGGADIYYSRKDENGKWTKAVNIGYPINTFADEIGLIVNARGNYAYFSTNRDQKTGKDIYGFDLYPGARPTTVSYVKGIVYDADTKAKLEARFELIDIDSSKTMVRSRSNPVNGEFLLCLPADKNYCLNVEKEGYLFYSDNFSLKGISDITKPYTLDVPLTPLKIGSKIVLRNIFFDTDKTELKSESTVELKKILTFMAKNPTLKVEISGHTDNVGTPAYNITLSTNRAKAVYDYLVSHGVSSNRLSYSGYGLTVPIGDNKTPEGRALNRRTEFKVTAL